jgi:hypothetical protein
MLKQTKFCIGLPPEHLLEIVAPTIVDAVAAAQVALPHVRPVEDERMLAVNVGGDVWYTLTCLLCDATNPQRNRHSSLVALQEHQMRQHGLTQRDFQQARRVFTGAYWAGQYIWALLRPDQTIQAYLRASLYTTAAREIPIEERSVFTPDDLPHQVRTQARNISLSTKEASAIGSKQIVALLGEDEQFWYGFATTGEWENCWLVWPKSAWQIA